MKHAARRQQGKGGIELIEEATHQLRTAPLSVLMSYYVGSLPFVLGLLYFWADMSRSPFAQQHVAEASLALGLLFGWMKFWQAVFAADLRAAIAGEPAPDWSLRRRWRLLTTQLALQPSGLFILPLALILTVPFPWIYAFYQNATVLAGETAELGVLVKKSWRQATLWPQQNHVAILAISVFGFLVFLNWTVVCLVLPGLAKTFFGMESVFTRSPMAMLNTTFFTAMFALTYLCVDPIFKALYVLRCFYGESLQSGADLKVELKQVVPPANRLAAKALFLLTLTCAIPAAGAESASPSSAVVGPQVQPSTVPSVELDRVIHEVIRQRKYVWRMPREKAEPDRAGKGFFGRFFDRADQMLRAWAKAASDWIENLIRKLFKPRSPPGAPSPGYGWIMALQVLLYLLIVAVAVALGLLLYRFWRDRHLKSAAVTAEAIGPAPDLLDEQTGAEQLPEDGWTKLARELLERGELRLALRAFYLASLAHLADRNLITLVRSKSNRDYENELRRRGHSLPDLPVLFDQNVAVFDRIWYGLHEVNPGLVSHFADNVERIRAIR